MVSLEIDRLRAEEVVTKLNAAFRDKIGVFRDTKELLENQIPRGVVPLSLGHACFLFYLISNDYGTRSAILYDRAKRLYVEDPTLFSPRSVLHRFTGPKDSNLIENTGVKLGARFPVETAKRWYLNSEKLWREYDGDPRGIFKSATDAKEVSDRIKEFRGFGPKIGALLLRTFVGCGFARLENTEKVLMPVDVHDTRISFRTGVVRIPGVNSEIKDYHKYAPQVQHVLSQACNAKGLDWLEVDRALWILGSKGCAKRLWQSCVLNRICVVGINQMSGK